MRRSTTVSLGLVLCVAWLSCLPGVMASGAITPVCASNHVLVRFKPESRALLPDAGIDVQLSALTARLNLPPGATLQQPASARLLESFLFLGLPPGLGVSECLGLLESHPLLEYAEPDWIGTTTETIPADPNFVDQWHHENPLNPSASIQTPLAWDLTRGSSNVLVAVLDTGLADDLAEFAGRVVPGYNFAYTNEVTLDDNGHGTQVAGVLAASANNGVLGAGVDWHCRIMPIKVFDSANQGLYSSWAQGIDFALSNGCKVINLSGSGTEFSRTVQRAITNAMAQGVIFVTAAGNEGSTNLGFPGYLRDCITVGATESDDRHAGFSNSGPQLDLVAPGVNIATVDLSGELEYARGTSFSAPMVAGACALLAALRPQLTSSEATLLLCAGAEDELGDAKDTPGFDHHFGWGRLNVFHSLMLAAIRIDRVRLAHGAIELSWASPSDAVDQGRLIVEFADSPGGPWTPRTDSSAFSHSGNRVTWLDHGIQAGDPERTRFYRVRLRL